MNRMEISFSSTYPANVLSNLYPHTFIFDGYECRSMEGFLQSLKFEDSNVRNFVLRLSGYEAKMYGRIHAPPTYLKKKIVFWDGRVINRMSSEYQRLLDGAYDALFEQCPEFRQALSDVCDEELTHTIGKDDPSKTILTTNEFLHRINSLIERTTS